ncbi:MAG: T9SS type A sorting domain-containing protein [Saprospiraceae bacterium]|nr:T9SS type A sorting domain-containing protein [Saprospiraceae bacterium]
MKKELCLLIALLCTTVSLAAQKTATFFQKTYKSNVDTAALTFQSVARTTDGGYALMGNYQNATNNGDMMVIRTDSLGNVAWTFDFASDTIESATGIRQTLDGGFVICGWNSSPVDFTKGEMLLAKVDASGALKWSTQFGGSDVDEAGDVAVLNSGDIVVAGRSPEVVGGAFSAYFLLTRANGVPENGQFIRFGTAASTFSSIDKTLDGGSIASGYTGTFLQRTGFDAMIVKFNNQGAIQWGKRYATAGTQFSSTIRQTRDTGYILIGQQAVTQPNGSVPQTFYVIKTKANGDTLWCKSFDTGKFEFARSVTEVSDGYIISGYTTTGIDTVRYRNQAGVDTFAIQDRQTAFAMKLDRSGVFKWGKLYGDSTRTSRLYSSTLAYDGGVTLVGETFGYGHRYGAGFVVHIDREGNIGAGTGCQIRNLAFTSGSFVVTDSSNVVSIEAGEEKVSNLRKAAITIIKTDICSGTGLNTDVADYHLPDNTVQLFPNPTRNQLTVQINEEAFGTQPATIRIYDAVGRLKHTEKTINDRVDINVSHYASGIYFLRMEQNGKFLVKKFIVE